MWVFIFIVSGFFKILLSFKVRTKLAKHSLGNSTQHRQMDATILHFLISKIHTGIKGQVL